MDDFSLLKAFVDAGDQGAFRALVERHIDLVYSAARRQVRDVHLAEDVTQAVFAVLARKAHSIHSGAALPAWLIVTTRYVSRDVLRSESRRQKHEKQAAEAMPKLQEAATDPSSDIAPLLDKALARLREADRVLVTLRFLKGQSIAQIAAATGITSDACEKRISRAVRKMRESFAARGVVLTTGPMLTAIVKTIETAPPDLASRTAEAALAAKVVVMPVKFLRWKLVGAGTKIAAAIVVTTLLAAGTVASLSHNFARHVSGPPALATKQIKTGVLLSAFTQQSWHTGSDSEFDLTHQHIIFYLRSPKIDLYVILEPGTRDFFKDALPRIVKPDHIIDGTDLAALKKLDVIVVGHSWHMRPEVLDAFDQAVQGGVGMLEQAGFAMLTPSFTPQVCAMSDVDRAESFRNHIGGACKVVAEHPLLKGLKVGDEVKGTMFYGVIGPINGTPLVAAFGLPNHSDAGGTEFADYIGKKLKRPSTMPSSADSFERGDVFCPLYVGEYGKGRIVACQWHDAVPPKLAPDGDTNFYARCIEWLARRDVE